MKSRTFMGMTRGSTRLCALSVHGIFILLAIAAVVFLSSLAGTATEPAAVIKMLDTPPSFQPSMVTIKVGDTVEWKNVGNTVHHATNNHDIAIKSDDVSSPSSVLVFDSGFLQPSDTFWHTFTRPGTYKYVCVVHESSGMLGEIVVK